MEEDIFEQLKSKFKEYTDFALPVFALLLVIILIPFQIIPTVQKIITLRGDITELSAKRIRMEEKLSLLSTQNLDNLKNLLSRTNRAVPSTKDIPSIFASVSQLVDRSSVALESIQINAGEISSGSAQITIFGVSRVEFQANISGELSQVRSFLNQIERTNRLFKIKSVNLKRGSGMNLTSGDTSATFVLYAFYQPLPQTFGRVDEPITTLTSEEEKIASSFPPTEEIPTYSAPVQQGGKTNPFAPL
jgi:Tfp pilus assembly protein PilO